MAAPSILVAPRIELDVALENLVATSISDVIWNNVSVDLPTPPTIDEPIAPNVTDPEEPPEPVLDLSALPEASYIVTDIQPDCPQNLDIPIPKNVTLTEWDSDIPNFWYEVPSQGVDWKYDEINYAIADLLSSIYKNFSISKSYRERYDRRSDKNWLKGYDPLTLMGTKNSFKEVYEERINRNLRSSKRAAEIFDEKIDLESKQVALDQGQEYERVQLDSHITKQTLLLEYVKSSLDTTLAAYNATIQKFNIQIQRYGQLAEEYRADIEYQSARIEKHRELLRHAELSKESNRRYAQLVATEITIQIGQIRLFQAQMDLARKRLRVQLLQAEVRRLEIQALSSLTQAKVKEVAQDIALQEAEVAKAQLAEIQPLQERLNAELEIAQTELDAAQTKFNAERDSFENLQTARSKLFAQFPDEVKFQEKRMNAFLLELQSRGFLAREQAQISADDAETRREQNQVSYEGDVKDAEETAESAKAIAETREIISKARVEAAEALKNAELAAEKSLAEADVQQTLTHTIQPG